MRLTLKQKAFADYYIQSGNATEAAVKAGYSKKTAAEMGFENLRKPHIAEYIEVRNKELESSRIADMTEVKQFWTNMLRDENIEPKDRLKASEFIAKTNAAFIDKVETKGELQHDVKMKHDLSKLSVQELKQLAGIIAKSSDTP